MKTSHLLGFGVLFWVCGAPTRIQTLKKDCTVTKRGSQSGGGDMEEKRIVLPELSCRTAAEFPMRQLRRGAARQLSSRSTIPSSSMSRFNMDFRESRPKIISPDYFSTMAEISPTTSLYLYQIRQTQSL